MSYLSYMIIFLGVISLSSLVVSDIPPQEMYRLDPETVSITEYGFFSKFSCQKSTFIKNENVLPSDIFTTNIRDLSNYFLPEIEKTYNRTDISFRPDSWSYQRETEDYNLHVEILENGIVMLILDSRNVHNVGDVLNYSKILSHERDRLFSLIGTYAIENYCSPVETENISLSGFHFLLDDKNSIMRTQLVREYGGMYVVYLDKNLLINIGSGVNFNSDTSPISSLILRDEKQTFVVDSLTYYDDWDRFDRTPTTVAINYKELDTDEAFIEKIHIVNGNSFLVPVIYLSLLEYFKSEITSLNNLEYYIAGTDNYLTFITQSIDEAEKFVNDENKLAVVENGTCVSQDFEGIYKYLNGELTRVTNIYLSSENSWALSKQFLNDPKAMAVTQVRSADKLGPMTISSPVFMYFKDIGNSSLIRNRIDSIEEYSDYFRTYLDISSEKLNAVRRRLDDISTQYQRKVNLESKRISENALLISNTSLMAQKQANNMSMTANSLADVAKQSQEWSLWIAVIATILTGIAAFITLNDYNQIRVHKKVLARALRSQNRAQQEQLLNTYGVAFNNDFNEEKLVSLILKNIPPEIISNELIRKTK